MKNPETSPYDYYIKELEDAGFPNTSAGKPLRLQEPPKNTPNNLP